MNAAERRLSKEPWYGAVIRELELSGLEYEFEARRSKGHPTLIIKANGERRKMPVPCTSVGRMRVGNLVSMVRQKIRSLK